MGNTALADANPERPTLASDQATVTITVAVEPKAAFRLFTEEIESGWRRGPRFRHAAGDTGIICLEPRIGGRVFESFTTTAGETIIEIGQVKIWEPPSRLMFNWRAANFASTDSTEVEMLFQAVHLSNDTGTRVNVVHRGWAGTRSDHPARHGLQGAAFIRMIGLWWGDQMGTLRVRYTR